MIDPLKPHSQFDEEITALQDHILRMGGMVEMNIYEAMSAFRNRDFSLANKVIEADKEIDELELEIEEFCLNLIALRQPMAKDLRAITTGMKIINELERMGDLAVNIAERAIDLCTDPPLKQFVAIPQMADLAQQMLRKSLDAFIQEDVGLALEVCDSDDFVDQLHEEVFGQLLDLMVKDPGMIVCAMRYILMIRYLERLGDLSTNIGEVVVFMVEGRNIRHAKKLGKYTEKPLDN